MSSMQKHSSSSNQGTRVSHRRSPLSPDSDLLIRTSWVDAAVALTQIRKGRAGGNKKSLWVRAVLQKRLFLLGCWIQKNAGNIVLVGLLVLALLCVGLKSVTIETDIERLWVEEGGRLEEELTYVQKTLGDGVGSTNQIIIHTPKEKGSNILHPENLLSHLQVLKAAVQVSVEVFDIPWSLKDMCYSPSYPIFEKGHIDEALSNLFPCAIITPLDCFWEGSTLLGPEYPVKIPGLNRDVQWTNLNPQLMLNTVKNFYEPSLALHTIESYMKRAGITTAYQTKPCLSPSDELCPLTAPNKKSIQPLDIGAELTGGCFGFASKYMHWPEDVLVGGVTKNKTGHIIRAEALQSIIQLMAEKEMYEYWNDDIKVHNLDWTMDKAKKVLEAWQRKFTEVVLKESELPSVAKRNTITAFSATSLGDIMKNFSEINKNGLLVGCLSMAVYAALCLLRFNLAYSQCLLVGCLSMAVYAALCLLRFNLAYSQCLLGICGVGLVILAIGAGLGVSTLVGFVFNAATTQVLPFVALGLGMDNIFLFAHHYSRISQCESIEKETLVGEILKRSGVNVILTSVSNLCAFLFAAYFFPIPAMRVFVYQLGILVAFTAGANIFIFPAFISFDIRWRHYKQIDLLSCIRVYPDSKSGHPMSRGGEKHVKLIKSPSHPSIVIPIRQAVTHALPPDGSHVVTVLQPEESWPHIGTPAASFENLAAITRNRKENKWSIKNILKTLRANPESSILSPFLSEHLFPALQKKYVKFFAIVSLFCLIILGAWGTYQVKDGLDLTDIVPRKTNEYKFLSDRAQYFGFFNMFAVTKGNFEYPTNQRLLYEYHDSFNRIDKIIKNDDGGVPEFWLTMFRDWLLGLQKVFDEHWNKGCITQEGWCNNATEDAIMAYKLLVQTGRVDNPVDKSLVLNIKLVDKNGIINPKAFYNYLSAWVSNDALAYSASQANFYPEPRLWIHDPQDVELKMPKSQPLQYAQIPFFLNGMGNTEEITGTIRSIRSICAKFQDLGLPNFPSGLPFTYWEQYLSLRYYLIISLICIFSVVFVVTSIILVNLWAATLIVLILAVILVQLFGFLGIMGIKLSAVPAVILIAAVGISVEFAVHIMMGFLTSMGSREHRMVMAMEHMFSPVLHGAISTLIGVILLLFSEFDFIFRYVFTVLCALVLIGGLNGFFLFPIILSIIGPSGDLVPYDDADRIPTPSPTPSPTPIRQRMKHAKPFGRRIYPRVPSEISLSTITEESGSCQSHEIVVQPEVVVETTTVTNTANGATTVNTTTSSSESTDTEDSSECNTPCGDSSSSTTINTTNFPGTTAITTKVTARAKVKVEVHAPCGGTTIDYSRHRRRKDSSSSRSSSARSSPT